MGIIGGILSIILSYYIQFSAHPSIQIILKLLIVAGGIIAIVGGAKANSNPKQARILMIVGGIISLGNLISIIGGALTREVRDEEIEITESIDEEKQQIQNKKVVSFGIIILLIAIISFFIATQRALVVIRTENLLLIVAGIFIIIGGSLNRKVHTIIGSCFGIAACTFYIIKSIISITDIAQSALLIGYMMYLCFGIVSLFLVILSLIYIQKEQII
ncbi:MAG: hypothetical protein ACFFCM_07075 [Promethearchaeota archaeon]